LLKFANQYTILAAAYASFIAIQRLKTTLSTYFFTNPIYQQKQQLHEK
jgi:hypothetical protein